MIFEQKLRQSFLVENSSSSFDGGRTPVGLF